FTRPGGVCSTRPPRGPAHRRKNAVWNRRSSSPAAVPCGFLSVGSSLWAGCQPWWPAGDDCPLRTRGASSTDEARAPSTRVFPKKCMRTDPRRHYYYRESPRSGAGTMDDRCLETALYCLRRVINPTAPSLSDGKLLNRFVDHGDQAAFELLLRRHGPLVWNVCRRVLIHTPDVEDALQATWVVFLRKAASLRHYGSVAGWLYRVAYRIAVRAKANAALCRGGRPARREREAVAADAD